MLKYSLYFTFLGLVLVMNEDLNASPNNSLHNSPHSQTTSASEDFRIAGDKTSEGLKKTGKNIKKKAKAGIQKVGEGANYLREKVYKGQDKVDKADQKIKDGPTISTEEAKDYSQANWHKVKGRFREVWGRLTDDDLEKIQGNLEQLYGVLQEKYGYTRAEAERAYKEVRHRFKK